jgi:Arc/MetJ family transcription regulator
MIRHLDNDLVEEARRLSGLRTKKAVVDKALETFIRCAREREAVTMFGKLDWVGELDASRGGRIHDATRPLEPAAPKPASS